ncbi:hypothetical protein L6R29_11645 [Myxococcota bacterium]|nr:hypothetical protein [Myxococcota bacterium]
MAKVWWLFGIGWLAAFSMSCSATPECINGIQISEKNTHGIDCTKDCDCSTLRYEGYCVNNRCTSTARTVAERKGATRVCKLLRPVDYCDLGEQTAQPEPLTGLWWGDCIAPKITPENTEAACSDGKDNDCDGLIDGKDPNCNICANGQISCAGGCVNPKESNLHCGSCGNTCGNGKVCKEGNCQCPIGQADCGGGCVDTKTSSQHCGSCGNSCAAPKSCVGGQCACPSSQTLCGGSCVDLASDGQNCGGCGKACATQQVCSKGLCAADCPSGQTICGGFLLDTLCVSG